MDTTLLKFAAPGARVTLNEADFGPYHGRVVVCLCKRHVYQPALPGRECGHAQCGYPPAAAACPWPVHVVWDDGNESHQGMDGLTVERDRHSWECDPEESALTRPVPRHSGEGAIYTPEYLRRREGNAHGTDGHMWLHILI
ncbi:hypothetical protein ACWC0A_30430 [Streptomyces scopuliridis]